jgi:hypothetical protein
VAPTIVDKVAFIENKLKTGPVLLFCDGGELKAALLEKSYKTVVIVEPNE